MQILVPPTPLKNIPLPSLYPNTLSFRVRIPLASLFLRRGREMSVFDLIFPLIYPLNLNLTRYREGGRSGRFDYTNRAASAPENSFRANLHGPKKLVQSTLVPVLGRDLNISAAKGPILWLAATWFTNGCWAKFRQVTIRYRENIITLFRGKVD